MPDANRLHAPPIRTLITAPTKLAVRQMAQDLSVERSLSIRTAADIREIWRQVESFNPRVVLLDVELAGDAIAQLVRKLSHVAGVATVLRGVLSDANILLDCLEAGALAVLDKPASIAQAAESTGTLIWTLRAAAGASLANQLAGVGRSWPAVTATSTAAVVAIGGGMGSLPTLAGILSQLPAGGPGAVAIAPLPAELTGAFVERLQSNCKMRVLRARDKDAIQTGQILIAPGDSHLLIRRSGGGLMTALKDGPTVLGHKPSVEVMFNSLAEPAGANAIGVLLGGSGVDGVAGLLHLRNRGGGTIAESSQTSVLEDLPDRAAKCNAAIAVENAGRIAAKIMEMAAAKKRETRAA
jgi:two-component system chemotaxis response regulator CheB